MVRKTTPYCTLSRFTRQTLNPKRKRQILHLRRTKDPSSGKRLLRKIFRHPWWDEKSGTSTKTSGGTISLSTLFPVVDRRHTPFCSLIAQDRRDIYWFKRKLPKTTPSNWIYNWNKLQFQLNSHKKIYV